MPSRPPPPPRLQFRPLTPGRWPDLVRLFGERGACGGCWCMWWRLPRSRFVRQKGAGNRRAFKRIVDSAELPGLLAYRGGDPVGWCAVAPREPRRGIMPDAFAWHGTASAFRRAGFREVLRRSATRPIMRYVIGADSG